MAVEQIAARHARQRVALAKRTARRLAALWRRIDPGRIALSWQALLPLALIELSTAQASAARTADSYLDATTGETGSAVVPTALAGIASDGRPLASLLYLPVVHTLEYIGAGTSPRRALAGGLFELDMMARTQVADAGRVADEVALTARRQTTGFVRMVVGNTCSRCIVLAGRWYRWNAGFNRHPKCDCIGIPAAENDPDDLRTNPRKIFESMPAAEQDRVFGRAGAEAIREGADMNQVVNARRGITTADGRLYTTEGAGRRPRLMPEQIFREAKDRDDAIRLLRLHGYLR